MGRLLTSTALALLAAAPGVVPGVLANEAGLWGQCGGIGYEGPTTCVAGATCMQYNDWYHQCIPGDTPSTTSAGATTTSSTTTLVTSTRTTTTSESSTPTSETDPCALKFLITFGDSYSQTGFDVSSTKPSSSNPLGNPPLPGWTASGGLNWVGFLASQYNTSTLLAYNFAYGGATTDASIVEPWQPTVLSFIDQVAQFSASIASKPSYAPWGDNALFGIWIGVNDVGNTWWLSNYDELVERIMDRYFEQLQILYDAGARNFMLMTVPPIHRTPLMLLEPAQSQQAEAAAIDRYNAALAARLAAFTTANSGITAQIVDTAPAFNTAIDNPTAYGAPDASCYDNDGTSCLWFDNYHPGVEINRLVAEAVAAAWKDSYF